LNALIFLHGQESSLFFQLDFPYLDAIALFLLASVSVGEFDGVGGVLLAPLF